MKRTSSIWKTVKAMGTAAALWLLLAAHPALAVSVPLGAAEGWAILQIGSGKIDMSNPQGQIAGNVGVSQYGEIHGSGPVIQGDLFLGTGAAAQFSGNSGVTALIHPDAAAQLLLTQARSDAIAASAAAAALKATSPLNEISSSMTLGPGVYDLSSINLNHETLTLNGAGDYTFNVSGGMVFNTGRVVLTGGATEANVLFNVTGTKSVAFTGGGNDSELHGIILAPDAKVQLSPGLIVGEIIGGLDISIVSGAKVQGVEKEKKQHKVPDTGSSLLLMTLGLGFLASAKRKFLA